jgi:hypothetical protein
MKLAEIHIVITVEGDPSDQDTLELVAAYEELCVPDLVRDAVDMQLASRTLLCDAKTTVHEQ